MGFMMNYVPFLYHFLVQRLHLAVVALGQGQLRSFAQFSGRQVLDVLGDPNWMSKLLGG